MSESFESTRFAPAARASHEVIERQAASLKNVGWMQQFLDAVNEAILILNDKRQIVLANRNLAGLLEREDGERLQGLRPGEALGCIHACEEPGGCGTSEFCKACGAARAILTAQRGREDLQECRILSGRRGDALDLLVRTTPLEFDGRPFTLVAMTDISHEKRRRALERVFFHDLMNTAVGVRTLAHALKDCGDAKVSEIVAGVRSGSGRLLEEIAAQRDLLAAESHDLVVRPLSLSAQGFLTEVLESNRHHVRDGRCRILMDSASRDVSFRSDPTLLSRVLGNMLKNAVEACDDGQAVTVGCGAAGREVRFWVQNPGYMPPEVQLQVFKRSFSTKGPGRGLGTYGMRLLTERYLKGRIGFTSSPEEGTVFTATYPATIEPSDSESR